MPLSRKDLYKVIWTVTPLVSTLQAPVSYVLGLLLNQSSSEVQSLPVPFHRHPIGKVSWYFSSKSFGVFLSGNMLPLGITFVVYVVLLGYSHELLAFHVGLFLKPKYLLNSVKTDPSIVFTLTHHDKVKTSTPLSVFFYQRKKDYPADIDCLQNDPQKLSLYLSLYGTPKLPCASGSWQVLEDIVNGFISWSTVTPWHGWQSLIYVSSVLSRLGNHGYNC